MCKSIDVIIPVYNEQDCLERNILALHNYLDKMSDFSWNIIIADNASTDKTPQIAKELSSKHENILHSHIPMKGKGRALRNAFLQSNADIVCFMDADLSTDLHFLKLLIEGLSRGYDISVGSRVLQASLTERGTIRKMISRACNLLIKCLFSSSFSDAPCGFKALKTDVAKKLVPLVKNNNWFFDTELLLLAEYNKYRIFEIPIQWKENPKTKVNIKKTALEYLAGLIRLRCSIHKAKVNAERPGKI